LTHLMDAKTDSLMHDDTVGTLIRHWRSTKRRSQMDLALDAGISPRHLSFVETGRSKPSAEVLMTIADHLDVPLRTRNTWLLAAGYAPRYSEQGLDSARMVPVKAAIQRLLDTHDPYPGIALDGQWNVVLTNRAASKLLGLLPGFLQTPSVNIFKASLHPQGFAAMTKNFSEWGSYMVALLQRLVLAGRDENVMALAAEVAAYPNVQLLKSMAVNSPSPESQLLVPCVLQMGGSEISLFTTLTTFGSPRDITLHELCIELFYPADEASQTFLRSAA
jgi:transcriptional regulator with XRE-family HTH domain